MTPDYAIARADIVDGFRAVEIWSRLGWQEITRRYRRTVFGPFWATLSLGIFISALSFVWAPLFKVELRVYLPYLIAGMIGWSFVASLLNEGCGTFTAAEGLIKQLNFPYSTFAFTVVWRNMIVLLHHLVIGLFVYLAFPEYLSINILLFIPGLLLVAANGTWMVMLLGMVSSRYRDIPPLIGNIVQVMLFITPIFWSPSQLGDRGQYFVDLNFLYHLVDVLRSPLLGTRPLALSYAVVIAGAILGWAVTFAVYARFRRRIAFWL
jgi:ABC-type polysaccharide/polyol phosphate export permease